ncbi:MAG: hypothetical protein V4686_03725 [Patescibacteria group bacterium]
MKYKIGQIICLWELVPPYGNPIIVVREILVTITNIHENVLGKESKCPAGIGLKGIGNDGKVYEKHWDTWPDDQMQPDIFWTWREDGTMLPQPSLWLPFEAVLYYSWVFRRNSGNIKIVDKDSNPIEPKGDLEKCSTHGTFYYPGAECISCKSAKMFSKLPRRKETVRI